MAKSREWIKKIDTTKKFKIFPIQFANVDRIDKNNVVFLFDEVGTGKTISSGMMALDYLENNLGEDVLIITTNTLVQNNPEYEYGQFLKDWYNMLPFDSMEYKDRITIINNNFMNINKIKKEWGMVIIDEAHLFLNINTMRNESLKKIRSKKLVIMTASPIKNNWADLDTYKTIAEEILCEPIGGGLRELLQCTGKGEEELICSKFDIECPVTRYFKETVMSLNEKGFEARKAKRLNPEIWEYGNSIDKNQALIKGIEDSLVNEPESKFLIFTRYVDKEAKMLANFFDSKKYKLFENDISEKVPTYFISTGENSKDLEKFSDENAKVPTVLIVTYQIAEQGVNLPGFNYVINYHIPAYPSALEQRFGRIDRMSKGECKFSEINMRFLINKDNWDSNTANFYQAVGTYLHYMIPYLPSKNTILTPNIIENYLENSKRIGDYIKGIKELCTDERLENVIEQYIYKEDKEDKSTLELLDFCKSNNIDEHFVFEEMDKTKIKESIGSLRDIIISKLHEIESDFENNDDNKLKEFRNFIFDERKKNSGNDVNDKVFYSYKMVWKCIDEEKQITVPLHEGIKVMDAVKMGNLINNSKEYKNYKKEFEKNIQIPLTFNKYKEDLEKHFEEIFNGNKVINEKSSFEMIFSKNYKEILPIDKIWETEVAKKDYLLIENNLNELIGTLPFFKLHRNLKGIINEICFNKDNKIKKRFIFNPLVKALEKLNEHNNLNNFGQLRILEDFNELIIKRKEMHAESYRTVDSEIKNTFSIKEIDGKYTASNWLKLFYYCTKEIKEDLFLRIYFIESKKETRTEMRYFFHEYGKNKSFECDDCITNDLMSELKNW